MAVSGYQVPHRYQHRWAVMEPQETVGPQYKAVITISSVLYYSWGVT